MSDNPFLAGSKIELTPQQQALLDGEPAAREPFVGPRHHGNTQGKAATEFANGSRIEIIEGSAPAQGGPKPTHVHMDEVELIDPDVWSLDQRREQGRRLVAEMGLQVGDTIRTTWEFDGKTYGPHEGTIVELDDWIRCKPFSTANGVLHLPLTAVNSIARIERVG